MSNNNQLFTDITPNEEANLSGGMGYVVPKHGFISIANAKANSAALGGYVNIANTQTNTVTAPGVALSNSESDALSIG